MVIKHYIGYKLDINDLETLNQFVKEIRENIQEKNVELQEIQFDRIMVDIEDRSRVFPEDQFTYYINSLKNSPGDRNEIGASSFVTTHKVFMERLSNITELGHYDHEFDFSCNLDISPAGDICLMLVDTRKEEYYTIIREHPLVTPYNYWGGSVERERGVSEEEWEKRGKAWTAAFGDTPSNLHGVRVTCVNPHGVAMMGFEHLDEVPSKEDRIKELTTHILTEAYFRVRSEDTTITGHRIFTGTRIRILNRDGYLFDEVYNFVNERIPDTYEIEDFNKPYKDKDTKGIEKFYDHLEKMVRDYCMLEKIVEQ